MVNSKDKGAAFERELVKTLNEKIKKGTFKKVPGSGAIGTVLNEPLLTADIKGTVEGFPKTIKIECKVGYGGKTQLALKRAWLNKIKMEADSSWSFPILIGKFSGARAADGIQQFAVLGIDDLVYMFNHISNLSRELELAYEKAHKRELD